MRSNIDGAAEGPRQSSCTTTWCVRDYNRGAPDRTGSGIQVAPYDNIRFGSWSVDDQYSWSQVVKRLESLGHKAFAPTVAGHGKGVDKQVGYAEATQSVVDLTSIAI